MKLSLAFSPCPNDTFIFDALIHHKIDTKGIDFKVVISDVEQLNQAAKEEKYDITKLSFHAFANVAGIYQLLTSGSALGKNNGPLLISKREIKITEIKNLKIAIPGQQTTANMLLKIFFPDATQTFPVLFSEIEDMIIQEKADAGLIIHENRFTYREKGLKKIIDFGEFWEQQTGFPLPLGGIAIKHHLKPELKQLINNLVSESIRYAFKNPESSNGFIKKHSQLIDDEIIKKHIALYVNEYSVDMGITGKEAVKKLFELALLKGIIKPVENNIFVQ